MNVRLKYIDIAKSIGILLVIVGHKIPKYYYLSTWIYSFHLPLFFIISGMFINNKYSATSYIKKKINTLILPYIFFGIIISIIKYFVYGWEYLSTQLKTYFLNYGAMWFIPVLFVSTLIVYFIITTYNKKLQCIIYLTFAIISVILNYFKILLPLSFSTIFIAVFFLGFGNFMSRYNYKFENIKKINYIIILVFLLIINLLSIYFSNDSMDLVLNKINQPFFKYIGAITGSLFVLMICYRLEKNRSQIFNGLSFIGQNTLTILCFHMVIIDLSQKFIKPFFISSIYYKTCEFIVFSITMYVVITFVNKNSWLLGKFNNK